VSRVRLFRTLREETRTARVFLLSGTRPRLCVCGSLIAHAHAHRRLRDGRAIQAALMPAMVETISANSGLSEAPPTRKPSTSGCFERSAAFFALAEPPYWIRTASANAVLTSVAR